LVCATETKNDEDIERYIAELQRALRNVAPGEELSASRKRPMKVAS
jgi:hypothetical protein